MKRITVSIFFLFFVISLTYCKAPSKPKDLPSQKITTPSVSLPEEIEGGQIPTQEEKESLATQGVPSPKVPYQPERTNVPTNIELIIDASGSMNASFETATKIDLVKSLIKDLFLQSSPSETNQRMALRTFGSESPSDQNNCADSQPLTSFTESDPAIVAPYINGIEPKGTSPIGHALMEAGKDFGALPLEQDNVIILIADGEDSCDGDPCKRAEELHRSDRKVVIHVIGFDVDNEAAEQLKCVADISEGQFYLARNSNELRNAIDQSINSNVPYNLKLRVMAGASPLPSTITVFKANTNTIVKSDKTSGIKFYQLPPGSYDVVLEYTDSPEKEKPRKTIKGIELLGTTKAEQTIQFDFGQLTLSATDQAGDLATANYVIYKSGTQNIVSEFSSGPEALTLMLTPGAFDIQAIQVNPEGFSLSAIIQNLQVIPGETAVHQFKFQAGKLILKSQLGPTNFASFDYLITQANEPDTAIVSGQANKDGVTIELPPGRYDIYITSDPALVKAVGTFKLDMVEITGGDTFGRLANIETGTLKLSGKDIKGRSVLTEFSIRKAQTTDEVASTKSEKAPALIHIPPGNYDIVAHYIGSNLTPPPSILWTNVGVKKNETVEQMAAFEVGELRLIGKNSKEQRIPTSFTAYRASTTDEIATLASETNWVSFYLTPGLYSIKAVDLLAKTDPKPTTWLHDVQVDSGSTISREAIFTSGKIKLSCRGENNALLICSFRLFEYGTDSALFSGTTNDNWREYDIAPGKYYLEAGWRDLDRHIYLKKWINVTIEENEVAEMVMRF